MLKIQKATDSVSFVVSVGELKNKYLQSLAHKVLKEYLSLVKFLANLARLLLQLSKFSFVQVRSFRNQKLKEQLKLKISTEITQKMKNRKDLNSSFNELAMVWAAMEITKMIAIISSIEPAAIEFNAS